MKRCAMHISKNEMNEPLTVADMDRSYRIIEVIIMCTTPFSRERTTCHILMNILSSNEQLIKSLEWLHICAFAQQQSSILI